MFNFTDKVVVVNGGTQGIGFSAVQEFLSSGARVVLSSRNKLNVANAMNDLQVDNNENASHAYGVVGDFSVEDDVQNVFSETEKIFGGIDVLINASGISRGGAICEISKEDFQFIIENNLLSCFLACKNVIKFMKKRGGGRIVNVASIAGRFRSKLAGVHYTASKAGIIAMTRQLASELAGDRIFVNATCPSQTKTNMLKQFLTPELEIKLTKSIPIGRLSTPLEQAIPILFLASDSASYLNGAIIDVNGGQF